MVDPYMGDDLDGWDCRTMGCVFDGGRCVFCNKPGYDPEDKNVEPVNVEDL